MMNFKFLLIYVYEYQLLIIKCLKAKKKKKKERKRKKKNHLVVYEVRSHHLGRPQLRGEVTQTAHQRRTGEAGSEVNPICL